MAFVCGTGFEFGANVAPPWMWSFTGSSTSANHTGRYSCAWDKLCRIKAGNGGIPADLSETYQTIWGYQAIINGGRFFFWLDTNESTELGSFRLNTATKHVEAYVNNALVATGTATVDTGTNWHCYECHVKFADSGALQFWIDGVLDIDYSGDTKPGSATTPTFLCLSGAAANAACGNVDDWTVYDTTGGAENGRVGDVRYTAVYPTNNGTTSGLTGNDSNQVNNYQQVDDLAGGNHDSDTTYNAATADTQLDTYATTDPTLPGTTVLRYIMYAIAKKTNAGVATTARLVIHDAGGDHDNGSDLALAASYAPIWAKWDTNPNGGGAWDATAINAAELLGFKGTGAFS